jgi:hypothetical protein
MSTESLSIYGQKPLPLLGTTTLHRLTRIGSKLSVLIGGITALSAVVNFNPQSGIPYLSYSTVSWLMFRTISYLCTPSMEKSLHSKEDIRHGLRISDRVKVIAFSVSADQISRSLRLGPINFVITETNSQLNRIEFIASNALIVQFLNYVQMRASRETINYTLTPLYEEIQQKTLTSLEPLHRAVDLKISSFISLVVFVPSRCREEVKMAISQSRRETLRNNSLPTFTEQGVARWERLGVLKRPGRYQNCERDENETKITTEIHYSDLIRTLRAIVNTHPYNEVGYDVYLSYTPYDPTQVVDRNTFASRGLVKISSYVKFLFSSDTSLKLSNNVKLIVCTPSALADQVRAIIGENKGGLIGNYAHCTFTVGQGEASLPSQNPLERVVRVETVVAKAIFKTVTHALDRLQNKISYSMHPIFERIDTKTLRQKQYFWNTTITALQELFTSN